MTKRASIPAEPRPRSTRATQRVTQPIDIAPERPDVVTVSPKFQVVIPRQVREALELAPGQKLQAVVIGDRLELVPIVPMKTMRGFLKGIDTERDEEQS